jgi:hypothetical protein
MLQTFKLQSSNKNVCVRVRNRERPERDRMYEKILEIVWT